MPQYRRILVVDGSKYFPTSIWNRLIPETEFKIVGLTNNTDETVEKVLTLSPDIILVDLSHSETHGLQTVSTIRAVYPAIPIVTFTPISSREYTRAAFGAGATACLTKSEMADGLLQILRELPPV
jgi:DNA-binding NarL/FixJ family response regulator